MSRYAILLNVQPGKELRQPLLAERVRTVVPDAIIELQSFVFYLAGGAALNLVIDSTSTITPEQGAAIVKLINDSDNRQVPA